MAYKISEVEGIGPVYANTLNAAGIRTTDDLLQAGATPKGRKEVSEKTKIDGKVILSWVNKCDLFRVKGLGSEYTDLLEAAGVDTVKELRTRNAANLFAACEKVNAEKKIVRALPSVSKIEKYIEEAKKLEPVVEY